MTMTGIIILISLLTCALCLLIALFYIRHTEIEVTDKSIDLGDVLPIQTILLHRPIPSYGIFGQCPDSGKQPSSERQGDSEQLHQPICNVYERPAERQDTEKRIEYLTDEKVALSVQATL